MNYKWLLKNVLLVLLVCSGCSSDLGLSELNVPEGTRKFFKVSGVAISVANPRQKGERDWPCLSYRGSTGPRYPDDPGIMKYGIEIIKLFRLKSGEVVAPVFNSMRYGTRRAFFCFFLPPSLRPVPGEVDDKIWDPLDVINLPISHEVADYILLVKSTDEETGWRYFEIDSSTFYLLGNDMCIPDLLTLPKLESRKDHEELMNKYKRAQAVSRP